MTTDGVSYISNTMSEEVIHHRLLTNDEGNLKTACSTSLSYRSTSALIPQVLAEKFASPCKDCYGRSEE